MTPEQRDALLAHQPSWMNMTAPVSAHTPGDSTPEKKPVFPGNDATYGDQAGVPMSGPASGVPEGYEEIGVRAMVLDGSTYVPASGFVLWKPAT